MFNQSTYVMNEETQLLMIAIKISRALQVPIGISINVTNTTTTGMGSEMYIHKNMYIYITNELWHIQQLIATHTYISRILDV